MKLSRRETEILDYLVDRKASVKYMAQALEMRQPNATKCLNKLARYGLVSVAKAGRKKEIALSSSAWFGLSTIRSEFPVLRLSDIFVGYVPFLLTFLKKRQEFRLNDLDIPPATAKRLLGKLRRLGIISMPKKGAYHLRKQAEIVAGFCRNVLMQMYSTQAKNELGYVDHGIYSFDSAREIEAIFVTYKEAKHEGYWPTFYSVAHEYGLQLLPSGKFYYVMKEKKPDFGEIIIHNLALQKNIHGIIYASYLALHNKYDVKALLKKKQTYGLGKEYIEGFVKFIDSKGKVPFGGLKSLDEVRSLGYGAVQG
jgi:uncharacterized membrane protein